jgi:hypothetical protein
MLMRDPDAGATRLLAKLGVTAAEVEAVLASWLKGGAPAQKIDPRALATLRIDFEAVRERLEQSFGPAALERTGSGCLGICPRLKLALAYALDHAGEQVLGDTHVLLGILSVPESVAARVLGQLGVTLEKARTNANVRIE